VDPGYLTLISEIKGLNYPILWRVILLTFIRIAVIVGLAPFLGAKIIPAVARAALALTLTLVFLPTVLFYTQMEPISDMAFVGYAAKEVFIGFILGFISAAPFYVVQSSGILIDYLRGSSMMTAQDPTMQAQSSPIGIMFNNYLIVLFYALEGPLLFFDAVTTSFQIFPVNQVISAKFFVLTNPFWQNALEFAGQIFTLSIELAAPPLLAILMAEVFLGIANRLAPQVQIAFLGMSLKSLLGLALLWSGWFFILRQMSHMSLDWISKLQKIVLHPF
jgi:type III secretion protein T